MLAKTNYIKRLLIVLLGITLVPLFSSAQSTGYYAQTSVENVKTIEENNTEAVNENRLSRDERKHLLSVLNTLKIEDPKRNEAGNKTMFKLANFFTRLHLYPLAMKCFLKTLTPDSAITDDLPITNGDEIIIDTKLTSPVTQLKVGKSKAIRTDSILNTFADGKTAKAYAMLFHVKQPVRGKPKIYRLTYTGHTYITLIKYNTDSSYTAMTFGFGPKKDKILSATPFRQASIAGFRDDTGYNWDQIIGKFISKKRFEKVLNLTHQYEGVKYHLSKNNCTDFGLKAAEVAGLNIKNTWGKWPLGEGNNPGITGQSILAGDFTDADNNNLQKLFVDTDPLPEH